LQSPANYWGLLWLNSDFATDHIQKEADPISLLQPSVRRFRSAPSQAMFEGI
jgi:hypothetical protein